MQEKTEHRKQVSYNEQKKASDKGNKHTIYIAPKSMFPERIRRWCPHGVAHREVVPQKLHYQCAVFIGVFIQCVQLRNCLLKRLDTTDRFTRQIKLNCRILNWWLSGRVFFLSIQILYNDSTQVVYTCVPACYQTVQCSISKRAGNQGRYDLLHLAIS